MIEIAFDLIEIAVASVFAIGATAFFTVIVWKVISGAVEYGQ